MTKKYVNKKRHIIVFLAATFLLSNIPMVLAKTKPLEGVYLPALLAASAEKKVEINAVKEVAKLKSTGNFSLDYKQAINGLTPSRFSLEEVARRYNEMGYNASVCIQTSYFHLNGGPFDKIIINNKIYDILIIESPPKRWNHGPFSVDNHGQCKN